MWFAAQVWAFWKTAAYIMEKHSPQEVVFLNLDETSISFCPFSGQGCVVGKQDWRTYPRGPHMQVRKDRQRGAWTYLAVICDNPTIQAVLPHFLIASKATMPKYVLKGFGALPKTNLRILRLKSSWTTSSSMKLVLGALKAALDPFLAGKQVVLLWDCAASHLTEEVMAAARVHGLQLLYVPSGATALLQPLDVFSFAAFKHWVRLKYQEQRKTAEGGQPQLLAWVWQISQAPRDFFCQKKWKRAFTGVGMSKDVSHLHSTLKGFMERPANFPLPVKPTVAEVALAWPKKRKMSYAYASLFGERGCAFVRVRHGPKELDTSGGHAWLAGFLLVSGSTFACRLDPCFGVWLLSRLSAI